MLSEETKNRIKEIKKLKEANQVRSFQEHSTYYRKYKPRPLSNREFIYSNTSPNNRNIFRNYNNNKNFKYKLYNNQNYNPLVTMMITNSNLNTKYYNPATNTQNLQNTLSTAYFQNTQSTFYNNKLRNSNDKYNNNINSYKSKNNYNTIKNQKKTTFFGLDGSTPLNYNEKMNTVNSTWKTRKLYDDLIEYENNSDDSKNDEINENYLTTYNPNNNNYINEEFDTYKNFKNYNKEDEKILGKAFYNLNNQKGRFLDKDTKDLIYDKYGIENFITEKEILDINDNFVKNNNENKKNTKLDQTKLKFKSLSKITSSAKDYNFKNPYQSYKKMKVKNQLIKKDEEARNELLFKEYARNFDNIIDRRIQTAKMPKINVKNKQKNMFEVKKNDENSEVDKYDFFLLNNFENKNKKYNDALIYDDIPMDLNKKLTRTDLLNEIEIEPYVKVINFHPCNRTQFTVIFDDNDKLIIYGGLGGKKLGDIWEFDLNKFKWKRIYENILIENYNNNNNECFGEPLPRYGHSAHLYKNKMYIIGGQFNDWENNLNGENIIFYYDLLNNEWNMLYSESVLKEKKNTINNDDNNNNNNNINYNQFLNQFLHQSTKSLVTNKEKSSILSKDKSIKSTSSKKANNNNKNNKNNNNKNTINTLSNVNKQKTLQTLTTLNNTNTHKRNSITELSQSFSTLNADDTKILIPCLRRSHISILLGEYIFVYGGIDPNRKFLNDCWIYNITTNRWNLLEYKGRHPPSLAYHSSCLVFEKDQICNEYLTIYKVPPSQRKTLPKLKSQGIFFFGGMNENRKPTNLFFRLNMGIKPTFFDIPTTYGKPPSPRISCSMNFYTELNLIIIHGGKNDYLSGKYNNDICLLDMETMNWIHPKFKIEDPMERAEHVSILLGDKLLFFGGVNNSNLLNFDFTIVNVSFIPEDLPF